MLGGPIDFMKIVRLILVFIGIAGAYLLGQKSGKVGLRPDECDDSVKVKYMSPEKYADFVVDYDFSSEEKKEKEEKKKAPGGKKKGEDGWVCPKIEGAGLFGMPSLGKYWWAYLMVLIGLFTQFSFTCAGGLFGPPPAFQECLNGLKLSRGR